MNVSFVDKPYRACDKATLKAINNTSLVLDGRPLPGAHADSFSAGCAYERWIERDLLPVDTNVAIVQALLSNEVGSVHLSSGDGSFDHTYSAKGFRELEHGALNAYQHSKGYRLIKSTRR